MTRLVPLALVAPLILSACSGGGGGGGNNAAPALDAPAGQFFTTTAQTFSANDRILTKTGATTTSGNAAITITTQEDAAGNKTISLVVGGVTFAMADISGANTEVFEGTTGIETATLQTRFGSDDVRAAFFETNGGASDELAYLVYGFETPVADVTARAGNATFDGAAEALLIEGTREFQIRGTAELTANFDTNKINGDLTYTDLIFASVNGTTPTVPTFAVVLSENDIVGADFGGTAVLQVPVALQPSITGTRSEYSGSFFDTDASDVAGTWIFEVMLSGDEFTVQGAYIAVE